MTTKYEFNEYLSETKFLDDIDFNKPFRVMVNAPTGGGKTRYVVEELKNRGIPFVFLADTLLLMKQVAESYGISSFSASDKTAYGENQLITVYNHMSKLYEGKVVIIDEAHSLVADFGFKRSVIEDLLGFGEFADRVIMLSGTPLASLDPFYDNVDIFNCVKRVPKEYTIKFSSLGDGDNRIESAVSVAIAMRARGIIPVISLLNTKEDLNQLTQLLRRNGFENVGVINSVIKNGEADVDCTHYEELVEKSTITADVIITTYVQGYNIDNENCGLIFLSSSNRHSYIAIAQMVARFRRINNLEVYMIGYMAAYSPELSFPLMAQRIYESKRAELKGIVADVKARAKTDRGAQALLKTTPEAFNLLDSKLEINEQLLSHYVMEKISHRLYGSIETANTILNQYNIKLILVGTLKINKTMKTEKLTKLDYTIAVDEFFARWKADRPLNTNLLQQIYAAYKELKEFEILDADIKTILLQVFGDKKAFNKVVQGYSFRLSNDPQIKQIRLSIYKSFKLGIWYSSQAIAAIVIKIVTDNGGECNSSSKATEILNCLFETESSTARVDGKVLRGLTIKKRR